MTFEEAGIAHLSPSHLKMWRDERPNWVRRYLAKQTLFTSAAMLRGRAVEAGWANWLRDGDLSAAVNVANIKFSGELVEKGMPDDQKERLNIERMIGRAIDWGAPIGKLMGEQIQIEHWFPGIPVPVIGYVDAAFEQGDADLKSTTSLPPLGKARREHIRQVALYRAAREMRPHWLLYVTATKQLAVPVTDEETAWGLAVLHGDALALQKDLARITDIDTELACLPTYLPFPKGSATDAFEDLA